MSYRSGKFHLEYKQNEILTSDQGRLILMMYDGAIKNLQLAIESMQAKDIANKGLHIQKSHDIISELSLALDKEKGGELAKRLEQLYDYILRQLALANIKRADITPITQVLGVLNTLHSAWKEIIVKTQSQEPHHPPTAKQKFAAQC